jgi:hypothetical protein
MAQLKIKISELCNCLFGNQVQKIENAARKLLYILKIDVAEGIQLDNIGTLIGQERLGYSDEYYRIMLKVKIGVNISEGELERIITLWKTLTGAEDIKITDLLPGKVRILTTTYYSDALMIFMKDIAGQALAGGVDIGSLIIVDPTKFGFGTIMGGFNTQWANSY